MRARRIRSKAALVGGGVVLYLVLGAGLHLLRVPLVAVVVIRNVVVLVMLTAGGRIFRGAREGVGPRPWWKMTAGPAWSGALFVTFALFAVICLGSFLRVWAGSSRVDRFLVGSAAEETAAVAVLYGVSFFAFLWTRRRRQVGEPDRRTA
ncbi:hypothetical protein DEU32_11085 [Curtobacterium sp. AG1037]|uniref:hypothetical protein n=1 Tax=Curtobacterium sp. AG1037 TaxID=2183990 RepID=UPI000E0AEE2A|nr:hypothetical protein [Curtobacterium sp. AG1037]RDH96140.1 hypothetical protein DEU32_11085 [Curtobacterium sp. AG1037]